MFETYVPDIAIPVERINYPQNENEYISFPVSIWGEIVNASIVHEEQDPLNVLSIIYNKDFSCPKSEEIIYVINDTQIGLFIGLNTQELLEALQNYGAVTNYYRIESTTNWTGLEQNLLMADIIPDIFWRLVNQLHISTAFDYERYLSSPEEADKYLGAYVLPNGEYKYAFKNEVESYENYLNMFSNNVIFSEYTTDDNDFNDILTINSSFGLGETDVAITHSQDNYDIYEIIQDPDSNPQNIASIHIISDNTAFVQCISIFYPMIYEALTEYGLVEYLPQDYYDFLKDWDIGSGVLVSGFITNIDTQRLYEISNATSRQLPQDFFSMHNMIVDFITAEML